MPNIFKLSGYIIDPLGMSDSEDIKRRLNSYKSQIPQHLHIEKAECNTDDDSPLLKENCDLAHCEKYFKKEPNTTETTSDRVVKPGQKWRHFKEGKIVEVIAVAQDTENPGFYYVVYNCPVKLGYPDFSTWVRPLDMFLSEVDHEKYPNATQKYRLELVSDPNEV